MTKPNGKQITPVSFHNYRDAKNEINSASPQIQRPETEHQNKEGKRIEIGKENNIHKTPIGMQWLTRCIYVYAVETIVLGGPYRAPQGQLRCTAFFTCE